MPWKARIVLANCSRHIVQRGHNRSVVFAEDRDYPRLLDRKHAGINIGEGLITRFLVRFTGRPSRLRHSGTCRNPGAPHDYRGFILWNKVLLAGLELNIRASVD